MATGPLAAQRFPSRLCFMEPRVTENDLAMLLLGEDDLVALGAMLSLPAISFDDLALEEGDERGPGVPTLHI